MIELVHPNTVTSPFLQAIAFIINTAHHILICTTCEVVVDANNFCSHIVEHHKSLAAPKDMQEQFKRDVSQHLPWAFAPFPVPAPKQPIPEIYGLKQAIPSYMVCSICNHAYANAKTFKLHPCSQNNPSPKHFDSPAWRFSKHPHHGWFPVIVQLQSVIPNPHSAWEAYQEQMREAIPASSTSLS